MSLLVNGKSSVDGAETPLRVDALGNLLTSASETTSAKTVSTLLAAVTTNQTSPSFKIGKGAQTVLAKITGTGAVSGLVIWYGNHTESVTDGVPIAESNLSGTDSASAGGEIPAEYPYGYCVLSGISGTGAAVTATWSY